MHVCMYVQYVCMHGVQIIGSGGGAFGSSIVSSSSGLKLLHPDFPYLEAEV